MKNEDQAKDEKVKYVINKEAAKILALSSGKLVKYAHLIGEELLPCDQS